MVFHWCLSDSKSPQGSMTLLRILTDPTNAVVWMVSICPLIFKSSNPFINPLVTVPRAPIITCITVTFMFHSFFHSLVRSRYLSFFSLSILFCDHPGQLSLQCCKFSFSRTIIIRSDRLAEIRRSVCMSKSQRSLCVFFKTDVFIIILFW